MPTDAERAGDFSAAGLPAIFDPTTCQQFSSSGVFERDSARRGSQRRPKRCCSIFPSRIFRIRFRIITCSRLRNRTQRRPASAICAALAPMRRPSVLGGRGGGGGGRRAQQNQGLRQSMNANYNWSHSASDNVNLFPQLGGKTASNSYSLQAGYTVGYQEVHQHLQRELESQIATRPTSSPMAPDIETQLGILGPDNAPLNSTPLNYGLPSIVLSNIAGLNEQQPRVAIAADYLCFRDVQLDSRQAQHALWRRLSARAQRLSFEFECYGELYVYRPVYAGRSQRSQYTGSSLADFLLGLAAADRAQLLGEQELSARQRI